MIAQPIGMGNEEIITNGGQSVLNSEHLDEAGVQNMANQQVLSIYANKENFSKSGVFQGGLDVGIDPMRLSVDFNIKE